MTTRTLGQIASETMAALRAQASAQELSDPEEQAARWETVAQTVCAPLAYALSGLLDAHAKQLPPCEAGLQAHRDWVDMHAVARKNAHDVLKYVKKDGQS